MKGEFIKIVDEENEPLGLWYSEDPKIVDSPESLVKLFRDYDKTDTIVDEGVDGFEDYARDLGYEVTRIFCSVFNL